MTESYVDLTYRGLPLARRVKLTSVRPREGYVEMPGPMPVGTQLQITTDEGVAIDARVSGVTEQTAGAQTPPGMLLVPALAGEAETWWAARVTLGDAPAKPTRTVIPAPAPVPVVPSKPITAPMHAVTPIAPATEETRITPPIAPGPTSQEMTVVGGPPEPATTVSRPYNDESSPVIVIQPVEPEPEPEERGERTRVMDAAVADVMREEAAGSSLTRMTGIVDDGQRTTMMEAVDLAALGLADPSSSGSVPAAAAEAVPEAVDDKNPELESKPTAGGGTGSPTVKRRRKKKSPSP